MRRFAVLTAAGNVDGLTDVSQFDGTKNADGVWMAHETKRTGVRRDPAAGGVIVTMQQ